jgi:hypothetical protein
MVGWFYGFAMRWQNKYFIKPIDLYAEFTWLGTHEDDARHRRFSLVFEFQILVLCEEKMLSGLCCIGTLVTFFLKQSRGLNLIILQIFEAWKTRLPQQDETNMYKCLKPSSPCFAKGSLLNGKFLLIFEFQTRNANHYRPMMFP